MTQTADWCRDVRESEKADYRRHGVVLLKGIYPASWVADLARQLDDVFSVSAARATGLRDAVLSGESRRGAGRRHRASLAALDT